MTSKDHVLIAEALHGAKPGKWDHALMNNQWVLCCEAIAISLAQANPNFNRAKFVETCNNGAKA